MDSPQQKPGLAEVGAQAPRVIEYRSPQTSSETDSLLYWHTGKARRSGWVMLWFGIVCAANDLAIIALFFMRREYIPASQILQVVSGLIFMPSWPCLLLGLVVFAASYTSRGSVRLCCIFVLTFVINLLVCGGVVRW